MRYSRRCLMEPKSTDPIAGQLKCECGNKNHKAGLIVKKWGSLEEGIIKDKVKIQIFEGDEIKTVVVSKAKLMERLNEI